MAVQMKVENGKLLIIADIQSGTLSKSGKSLLVATTEGFQPVADSELKVSLNVIRPNK